MAFNIAYLLSNIILQIFSCTPIEKYYQPSLPGTCVSLVIPDIAWGAMSVLSDLAIAILPVPIIWRMKMSKHDRVLLSLVFLVGLIAFTVALVRWVLATVDLTSYDRTWVAGLSFMFCVLEINTGIVCGSVPTLKPLARLAQERSRSARRKSRAAQMKAADEERPLASPSDHSAPSYRWSDQAPRIETSVSVAPLMPEGTNFDIHVVMNRGNAV